MNMGINEMIHFYTSGDWVAGGFAGDDKYDTKINPNSMKLTQIELHKSLGLFESHTIDNLNLEEVLEKGHKLSKVYDYFRNPKPLIKYKDE